MNEHDPHLDVHGTHPAELSSYSGETRSAISNLCSSSEILVPTFAIHSRGATTGLDILHAGILESIDLELSTAESLVDFDPTI